jgi:hypothetical protein
MDHVYKQVVSLYEQIISLRATAHTHTPTGTKIEDKQFEAPPPIPQGVSISSKIDHVYRQIVSLHEQVADLRATAHAHTLLGTIDDFRRGLPEFGEPSPIPHEVSFGTELNHMYKQNIALYEQVDALRTVAHRHTPTGAEADR